MSSLLLELDRVRLHNLQQTIDLILLKYLSCQQLLMMTELLMIGSKQLQGALNTIHSRIPAVVFFGHNYNIQ
ncbi:MAG TPA: hypothetical protein VG168_09265 [Bryobacteraceae bacterium]|nr:hypothetical protein [Bryobacteraceae bacterium]